MPRSKPLVLLAPGAGAPSSSPWMRAWAKRLATLGRVVRFDYPYQRAGRKLPDRLDVLLAAHLEALKKASRRSPGPVVLAGKSMGSRIGCHAAVALAAEDPERVRALVCLGYPLRSPAGALRDAVLVQLQAPILFVQGDRDPLCPLPLLEAVRARMAAPSELYVVEGGDHSLLTRAVEGAEAGALAAIAAFLRQRVAR